MKRFYFCQACFSKIKVFDIEVYASQVGICDVCGKQASCFIQLPYEIEIPDERLKILE